MLGEPIVQLLSEEATAGALPKPGAESAQDADDYSRRARQRLLLEGNSWFIGSDCEITE
jgi:hypothetical protein